jgi:hypothetical protein
VLIGEVAGVEHSPIWGVEKDVDVVVAVILVAHRLHNAGDGGAGGDQLETVGVVDVRQRVA